MPVWLHIPLAAALAVLIDRLVGEPRRFHPLVGFGRYAAWLESRLNRGRRLPGIVAWLAAVGPGVAVAVWLAGLPAWGFAVDVLLLWFAIGARSLAEHGGRVAVDLARGDLEAARRHVGWMVSRDTVSLDAGGVARAGVESVLENGNDAVFGALFWFAVAGGPGALLFRLANTLDAMWGYRNARFLRFGWAAARIDDVLNWLPARLTALTYALLGRTGRALSCWRRQAGAWDSPNAGPVMAAGAGALGVSLGGAAIYHGRLEARPGLGLGPVPGAADIDRAVGLVGRGLGVWLAVLFIVFFLGARHA